MAYHGTDRRRNGEAAIARLVRAQLDEALTSRSSLLKNGETWLQWVGKVVTPERALLAVVAVFTIGGQAQRLEMASTEALETAKETARVNAALTEEMGALRNVLDTQAGAIAKGEEMHATKADVAALDDRVKTLVTRQEMRRVLNEELLPRLKRLDQLVPR